MKVKFLKEEIEVDYNIKNYFGKIVEERKSKHKTAFDAMNDIMEESLNDQMYPIIDRLAFLGAKEKETDDEFLYTIEDTEGKEHTLFSVSKSKVSTMIPIMDDLSPSPEDFKKAYLTDEVPEKLSNPYIMFAIAFRTLATHVVNRSEKGTRALAIANGISAAVVVYTKGKILKEKPWLYFDKIPEKEKTDGTDSNS